MSVNKVKGGMSKIKKKNFSVKKKKVKMFSENENILYVFMWGVKNKIDEIRNVKIKVMIMKDDFREL